jgi:glycosyltransferase involved in cell wall biosynthesis
MSDKQKRILYIQYTNPGGYPPLEHSSRILADEGWNVLFLGIDRQSELQFPSHPRIHVKLMTTVGAGWRQKLHYFWFCLWLVGNVIRWRTQWIYASDPLITPPALILSYLPWLKVIYHEHDSPLETSQPSRFMRLVLWARGRLAHRVVANVLPNAKRGELLKASSHTAKPIFTVWNCPSRTEVPATPAKADQPIRLLYHGTIVPQRLPLTIIEAVAQVVGEIELHIVGYETQGAIGYSQTLRDYANQLGIGDRLRLHGILPTRADLLRHATTCHIGLAFMPMTTDDMNLETMAGASNKPFDYMACGLALLVSPLPEWEQLYVATGYGIACDPTNPESLARAMQWYTDHPTERQQMGEAGRVKILSDWNYERQFQPIHTLITAPHLD